MKRIIFIFLLLAPLLALAQWPWGRRDRDEVVVEPQQIEQDTPPGEEPPLQEPNPFEDIDRRDREPRRATDGVVNVALLLPLQGSSATPARSFLEFYQGARLGVEDLGRQGIDVRLNLYDTYRSDSAIAHILEDEDFRRSDLILGPVYEEELQPVLAFADRQDVAVVSPLAQLQYTSSPLLYQLPPDPTSKYDKLRAVLSPDSRVVVVGSAINDTVFAQEIAPLLPPNHIRLEYSRTTPPAQLDALVRGSAGEVVFVVLAAQEYAVDEFLSRMGSLLRNLSNRSVSLADIKIVGSPRWARFPNIDRRLYFQLGLHYVTSYHADNSDLEVQRFNKRYIAAFGALPTPYSYRGYDAAKLFAATAASRNRLRFEDALNLSPQRLLQTPYHFENQVNTSWPLVKYRNDYTIQVE